MKTPKEKATELFYKFDGFNTYGLDKQCCKKSAIFLAEEIIKETTEDKHDYWNEVIKEIEII